MWGGLQNRILMQIYVNCDLTIFRRSPFGRRPENVEHFASENSDLLTFEGKTLKISWPPEAARNFDYFEPPKSRFYNGNAQIWSPKRHNSLAAEGGQEKSLFRTLSDFQMGNVHSLVPKRAEGCQNL